LGAVSVGMNEITTQADGSVVRVRVQRAQRDQIRWRDATLDQMVHKDHRVRAVWAYVDSLDLKARYRKIQAVEGGVGRDAVEPRRKPLLPANHETNPPNLSRETTRQRGTHVAKTSTRTEWTTSRSKTSATEDDSKTYLKKLTASSRL
jgi:hypothetical protein